jgi:hypothetical protein
MATWELQTMDSAEAAATFKVGLKPDLDPDQELALQGIAELVQTCGLEAATGDSVALASDVLGCLPILGAVVNLGSGAINAVKAATRHMKVRKINELSVHITPGNPTAAIEAVKRLMERKRTEFALTAALDSSAGAVQLTGMFVDLGAVTGPTVGVTKSVMSLAHSIFLTIRNYSEFSAANQILLSGGPYNAELIAKAPILGAYLITEAEHSTLLAMLSAGQLPSNWMDLVHDRRKDLDTLIRLANECQREAPFVLRGYQNRFSSSAPLLKGEHYLDFRAHKSLSRVMHEAKMIMKRDPGSMRFFGKHLLVKLESVGQRIQNAFRRT